MGIQVITAPAADAAGRLLQVSAEVKTLEPG
jgi:hypothetical protein